MQMSSKKIFLYSFVLFHSLNSYSNTKKNVLFIVVDDLRTQLGCYGDKNILTPNIDSLASKGVVFNRAYCQMALSGPSRMSFLTGYRPTTTKIFDIDTPIRKTMPNVVTLPQHFKNNGYITAGLSKIFHQMGGMDIGCLDDSQSWSVPHWNPKHRPYNGPKWQRVVNHINDSLYRAGVDTTDWRKTARGGFYEAVNAPDSMLQDGATTIEAIKRLREYKNKPFFLAVGYVKPHLPLVAPKKYYDMYDLKDVPLAINPFSPINAPDVALSNATDWRWYIDSPKKGLPSLSTAREWVRAYMACISFIDAQIGMLIKELKALNLYDNTVIMIVGDNGFQMGEHGMWGCKHTNYETSTRIPLIVVDPSNKQYIGHTDAIVELTDIYSSLVSICGLPKVVNEGKDFSEVLLGKRHHRDFALSLYRRNFRGSKYWGCAIRTKDYRFVQWTCSSDSSKVFYELYDHRTDPNENYNLATVEEYYSTVDELKKILEKEKQASLFDFNRN